MIFGIKFEHKGVVAEIELSPAIEYATGQATITLMSRNGLVWHSEQFPIQPYVALTDAITRYLWPSLDWNQPNPPAEALVVGRLLQFLDTPL